MNDKTPMIEWMFILERRANGKLEFRVSDGTGFFRSVSLERWGRLGREEATALWGQWAKDVEGDTPLPF